MSNKIDEILDDFFQTMSVAEIDGGLHVRMSHNDLATAKQQIQALVTEARIDELNAVFVDFDQNKLLTTGDTKTQLISFEERQIQLKENK